MAPERKLVLNPPARLDDRDTDILLTGDQLAQISLFAKVKRKPKFDETPGAIKLRFIRKGEILVRQGEAGWTAMYPLKPEDLANLGPALIAGNKSQALLVKTTLDDRATRPLESEPAVAFQIALPRRHQPEKPTGIMGLFSKLFSGRKSDSPVNRPKHIPIDAPRDADLETRTAMILEGELFGEMSCKTGAPRSGTIVAEKDGFLLEMLRSVLDLIESDPGFREEFDQIYKNRMLEHQLPRMPLFSELSIDQLNRIKDHIELVSYKIGQVIFHENDRSDGVYIIRSGLVQATKNQTDLISIEDITDWSKAIEASRSLGLPPIAEGEANPFLCLGQSLSKIIGDTTDALHLTGDAKQDWVYTLNDFIKSPFSDTKTCSLFTLPDNPTLRAFLSTLNKDPKQWSDLDKTSFGRRLVETILPGTIRPIHQKSGLGFTISYLSKGETFGEMGVLSGLPRSASCIAYVHGDPGESHQVRAAKWRKDESLVHLFRIPKNVFEEIVEQSPAACLKIIEEITLRAKSDAINHPQSGGVTTNAQFSEKAKALGLMQGQSLMMIDLDKCTRCDECVRACVDTHEDGRSRLFLDGPRFENHLVPAACRSCIDPVCMIGCPVGSIHRGNNRQIVIEDWCIGCGLCANNCPYGSIQMHDRGILPEGLAGWQWTTKCPKNHPVNGTIRPPLVNGLEFHQLKGAAPPYIPHTGPITFTHEFAVDREEWQAALQFRVSLTCPNSPSLVKINGKPINEDPKWGYKQGRREYVLNKSENIIRPGKNRILATIEATGKDRETLFELRIDGVHEAELPPGVQVAQGEVLDISEKLIKQVAVVCDLCSNQWGMKPACVNACPHDAAIRIEARSGLPVT